MWRITIRDIAFRRRQFLIAVIGAGIVFGLALLLTGVSRGFRTEVDDTVARVGADAWIVPSGGQGPFSSATVVPERAVRVVAAQPGVRDVRPFVALQESVVLPGGSRQIAQLFGGSQRVAAGTVVADDHARVDVGDRVRIRDRSYRVAGKSAVGTIYGGQPVILVPFRDAQALRFGTAPALSAVLASGPARAPGPGTAPLAPRAVSAGALVPMDGAIKTVDLFRTFMWIVAAIIVAAITYLSVLERLRDFAVLKAVGGTSRSLVLGVVLGSVIASLLAVLVAWAIATALGPFFPMPVDIRLGAYLAMPVVAIVVGVVASLAALRRVQRVDPALAFG